MCLVVTAALATMLVPAPAAGEAPVAARTPVSTEAPRLTGTPAVGQALSCSQGTWANSPSGYAYAWLHDGSPVAGQSASTYIVQSADQGHSISCQVTTRNAGGEYTIAGLPSGSFKVHFFPREGVNYLPQYFSGRSSSAEANPVSVTAPNTTSELNAALQLGGQITGKVTASSGGAAIANIEVCANSAGGGGGCGTTSSGGEYVVAGLPTGEYKVYFSGYYGQGPYQPQYYNGKALVGEANLVGVTAGSTTAGIDAVMGNAGQITGKVTVKATKMALAGVDVCASEGEFFQECAKSNASGEYTISGLPAGQYTVSFNPGEGSNYAAQYYSGKSALETANPVTVTAAKATANINAELQEGGEITGKVNDSATKAAIKAIEVCAYEPGAGYYGPCTTTNAAGEYTLAGLPSGSYTTIFESSSTANYITLEVESVAVVAGTIHPGINAAMLAGGQITGKVTAASGGAALASVKICASKPGTFRCATTSAGGEYTVSTLPTGEYTVHFYTYEGPYLAQYYSGKVKSAEAVPVSVTAGSTTASINAALQTGGQITGRTTAAVGGAAIANIAVCANGPSVSRCATTNSTSGPATATSNKLAVPLPNSGFSLTKAAAFEAKKGNLDFFFVIANAGTFRWNLLFRNSDVAFADALGLTLGRAAGDGPAQGALADTRTANSARRCRAGFVRHKGRCVHVTVPFASGSRSVQAGTVEIKVHAGAKALKALRAGHTLHVSGTFRFQSALGGAPVTRIVSAVVHPPKGTRRKSGRSRRH